MTKVLSSVVKVVGISLLLAVVLYPQLWLILGSFKTQNEFFTKPSWSLPSSFSLENYVTALTKSNVATMYLNSLAVTLPSLFFMLLFGIAAGYVLEVMVWKGRQAVLLYFLAGIMVPGQMILGADSHTPHFGWMGAFGAGIGTHRL